MSDNMGRLRRNLWFAYFSAILVWGISAYGETLRFFRENLLFARVMNGHPYISDFVMWYNAARIAASCQTGKVDIYDPILQNDGFKALIAPIEPELSFFIQYPPQLFALVRPLAYLDMATAWIAWCALAAVLITLAMWFLIKDTFKSAFGRAFVLVATFTSYPAWLSFKLGQTSLYQFPANIAFWLLLRSQRFFLAGLVSGLLLIKLQYVPIIVLTGLIIGRLRYLAGLCVSGLALGLLSVATVGLDNIVSYPNALIFGETSDKVSGVAANLMQNIRGQLILFSGSDSSTVHMCALALFALSLLLTAFLWLKVFPRLSGLLGKQAFDLLAGVTVLVMLIFSPHTHTQEFLSATIAIVFLYPLVDTGNRKGADKGALQFLLLAFPFLSWLFFLTSIVFVLLRIEPFLLWTVLVLIFSARLIRQKVALAKSGIAT